MPRYEYYCEHCKGVVVIRHLSAEKAEKCPQCERADKLEKLLSEFRTMYPKKTTQKRRVGQITKEFINDAREDLKKQRKDLDDDR